MVSVADFAIDGVNMARVRTSIGEASRKAMWEWVGNMVKLLPVEWGGPGLAPGAALRWRRV